MLIVRFALAAVAVFWLADPALSQFPAPVKSSAPAKGGASAAKPQDTGVPNAVQGFSQNKDQPVQIEAANLEVRDKEKIAIFTVNVVVTQGDTVMKCKELHVFYEQDDPKKAGAAKGAASAKGTAPANTSTMKAAQPGPGGKQSIRRLEARGGVIVTTKDQTATGALGIFEMKTNTVTLLGNVVVAQGENVVRGDRLIVDLTTSYARVESDKGKPVQAIFFTTSKEEKEKEKEKSGASGQAQDGQKPALKKKPTSLPPAAPAVTN